MIVLDLVKNMFKNWKIGFEVLEELYTHSAREVYDPKISKIILRFFYFVMRFDRFQPNYMHNYTRPTEI